MSNWNFDQWATESKPKEATETGLNEQTKLNIAQSATESKPKEETETALNEQLKLNIAQSATECKPRVQMNHSSMNINTTLQEEMQMNMWA